MAKGLYEKWLLPENLTLLKGWRRDGLDMAQIARNVGIKRQTLYDWCYKYKEIGDALKKGAEICHFEVENALYKSAIGYDVTETEQTETIYPDGTKTTVKRARKRHIPPNVGSICFILKNRMPDKWRDHPEIVDNSAVEVLTNILKTTRDQALREYGEENGTSDGVQPETDGVHSESESPV